jgi:outer membrane protein assembly factor BamB
MEIEEKRVGAMLTAAFAMLALTAQAADWPQWRGPNRDGHSPDTGLLRSWPEGGPPLAWQVDGIGAGYSSVSVAGDHIYTMGDLDDGQYVFALKRADGQLDWKAKIGPVWADGYGGSRSTPTVDGDSVYALGTEGDLVAFARATGEERWRRSLPVDFAGVQMAAKGTYTWKYSESVLVDGGQVVATPGARAAALVALDKRTGEEKWRAAVPAAGDDGLDGAGYSSIVVSEACGVRQYVQLAGPGLLGIEAATGRYLWGYSRVANKVANIATPIVHESFVFASTGYGTGSALLELTCQEGGVDAKEVYFLEPDTMQNHHGGLILHEGYIYSGTGHNKGFPLAVDLATGEVAWGPIRNAGKDSAAVAFADGRLYYRYQNGLMVLVAASPKAYEELGSFMIPNVVKESWAHPVVAGRHLYLREQGTLYSYDVSAN